jgi:hypothetical protein
MRVAVGIGLDSLPFGGNTDPPEPPPPEEPQALAILSGQSAYLDEALARSTLTIIATYRLNHSPPPGNYVALVGLTADGGGNSSIHGFERQDNGTTFLFVFGDGAGGFGSRDCSGVVSDWAEEFTVAVTYDAGGNFIPYVADNGDATFTAFTVVSPPGSWVPTELQLSDWGYAEPVYGTVRGLKVFSATLDASRLNAELNAGPDTVANSAGLYGHWPLSGDATDHSGNGRESLVLVGSPAYEDV